MEESNPVVWISHKDDERCAACGAALSQGDLIQLHRELGIRCLKCAGLGGWVFLPSGDPALTRRAAAGSARHAVVVKFSRARKRNERQGVLVEEAALARARESCARDARKREAVGEKRRVQAEIADVDYRRRFEMKILDLFPSCPITEARAIAEHACRKHSGRVGRSAAAKALHQQGSHTMATESKKDIGNRAQARKCPPAPDKSPTGVATPEIARPE